MISRSVVLFSLFFNCSQAQDIPPAVPQSLPSPTVPVSEFDQTIYAGNAVDRANRERDFSKSALVGVLLEAYHRDPHRDLNQLQRRLNELQDKYDAEVSVARSSKNYHYYSQSESDNIKFLFDTAAKLPEVGPAAEIAKRQFELYSAQLDKKYGPENQIAAQSRQFDSYAKVQAYQQDQWRELARLSASDPDLAKLVDNMFAKWANASVNDHALQIVAKNSAFRDSQLLTEIGRRVGPDGTLGLDIDALRKAYQEDINLVLLGISENRKTLKQLKAGVAALYRDAAARKNAEKEQADRDLHLQIATSGVFIISTLVGFRNQTLGRQISVTGNSVISIADSLNKFQRTLASNPQGLNTTAGVMSSIILTGNILGAVSSIISLFGDSDPPDKALREQLEAIQRNISALRQEMNDRFDRVDLTLNRIYPVFAVLGSSTSTEMVCFVPAPAAAGACEGVPIPANAPFSRLSESTTKLAPVTTRSPAFSPCSMPTFSPASALTFTFRG